MTANPYMIDQGPGYGPALQGLSGQLSQHGTIRRQKEKEQRAVDKFAKMKMGAVKAYQTGDPDKIAEFSLQNPEMAQAMTQVSQFKSSRTEKNYMDSLFSAYQDPSAMNMQELVTDRQALLQGEGVGPEGSQETDSFMERFNADPDSAKKQIGMELAFRYPKRWKSMQGDKAAALKPGDRYKVVDGQLVDLTSEGGPEIVLAKDKAPVSPLDQAKLDKIRKEIETMGVDKPMGKVATAKLRKLNKEIELMDDPKTSRKTDKQLNYEYGLENPDFVAVEDNKKNVIGPKDAMVAHSLGIPLDKTPTKQQSNEILKKQSSIALAKKSGMRVEVGPDGGIIFEQGPGATGKGAGLGRRAKGDVESKMIDAGSLLYRSKAIEKAFDPKFLEWGTQLEQQGLGWLEKAGMKLTPEQKAQKGEFITFKQTTFDNLNRFLSEISGAAVNEHEMNRLKHSMPTLKDSPTDFKRKLDNTLKLARDSLARYSYVRKNGFKMSDVSLDEMPDLINERGEEVFGEIKTKMPDMSDAEIHKMVGKQIADEFGLM